jgi:putative flippase GtrA
MAARTERNGSGIGSTAAVPAFVRFVVFGGGVTLLGSVALLLVGDRIPLALATAVVTVATTVLATELHCRFTFRRGRASWSDHCASGLTVLMSYLFTTGALVAFDTLHPHSGALLRQGVYLAASGLAGVGRFVLLRLVVFANARAGRATGARQSGQGLPREAVTAAA